MPPHLDPLNSKAISNCQVCASTHLDPVLFVGYFPPVNTMPDVGTALDTEMRFPLELLRCRDCSLVQIGYYVDQRIMFPHDYPYLSGTTRSLRDNFRDLVEQCRNLFGCKPDSFVIDIGANDGTLPKLFKELGFKTLGIEPSQAADIATREGITMVKDYFSGATAAAVAQKHGQASIVTATNVFAHMTNIHDVMEGIKTLLRPDGVFISESHYLLSLIEKLQYDKVNHEHLRYYALGSLAKLFEMHGLEIFRAQRIPTHGGSIRVFAARKGTQKIDASYAQGLEAERKFGLDDGRALADFRRRILQSKFALMNMLADLKRQGKTVFGIGAPSRASTLVAYAGIDDAIVDCVMEMKGSHKLNKYMPGTRIPVLDEEKLYREQPDFALLLSWHIADEVAANLRKRGYNGHFIAPLPEPRIF